MSEVNTNEQVQNNSSNTNIQEEARMRDVEKSSDIYSYLNALYKRFNQGNNLREKEKFRDYLKLKISHKNQLNLYAFMLTSFIDTRKVGFQVYTILATFIGLVTTMMMTSMTQMIQIYNKAPEGSKADSFGMLKDVVTSGTGIVLIAVSITFVMVTIQAIRQYLIIDRANLYLAIINSINEEKNH